MDTRQRIIETTAELLQQSPVESVSTRAICEAANVTAPTLYHHFGDKAGLLDAVVTFGFETYLVAKHALIVTDNPVIDLAKSWDVHVEFGVAHPALYSLMYGTLRATVSSPAAKEAEAVLVGMLERVARNGGLRIGVERAASIIGAACTGATLQAIQHGLDPTISAQLREAVFASVIADCPVSDLDASLSTTATHLAALLRESGSSSGLLTKAELAMLDQWLDRLSE